MKVIYIHRPFLYYYNSILFILLKLFYFPEELLNATIAMTPVLNVTNITAPENGGEYICIAVNEAGAGLSTSTLYVIPEFLQEPQDIETEDGVVESFMCVAESFPFPVYQWERLVNGEFEVVSGENETVLLFNPVRYADAGVYRCVVTNTINNTLNSIESQNATLFGKTMKIYIYILAL